MRMLTGEEREMLSRWLKREWSFEADIESYDEDAVEQSLLLSQRAVLVIEEGDDRYWLTPNVSEWGLKALRVDAVIRGMNE